MTVVYIGASHPLHHQLCLGALKAKKHVVCEKPLAMNSGQVEDILCCAAENNCFLLEGMWTRFFPLVKKIRELVVEERKIGDVKLIQADFGVAFGRDNKRIWDKDMGGGALLDVGRDMGGGTLLDVGRERPRYKLFQPLGRSYSDPPKTT